MRTLARRFLTHRLTHFLALGGLLFALSPRPPNPRAIGIPRSELDAMHTAEARRLGLSALPPDKVREVDERAVEDELLYREAVRLGLDRDDPIVRQRLIQKVLFLAEDLGGASNAPSAEEVRAYFEATKDRRRGVGWTHFVHVFASSEEKVLALRGYVGTSGEAAPGVGEAFPYPRDTRLTRAETVSAYGAAFAAAVDHLPVGEWSGPVQSSLGWHLVRVLERQPVASVSLDDVEGEVALECAVDKRERVVASFLRHAFDRYRVDLGGERLGAIHPGKRIAPRTEASAED